MVGYEFVLSSGEKIPVVIATRRGLRNITLRPKTRPVREIHISKPWMTSNAVALRFLEQKRAWCERIYNNAPQKQSVRPGDVIEFLGRRVVLRHDPARRANDFILNDNGSALLIVGGGADMF